MRPFLARHRALLGLSGIVSLALSLAALEAGNAPAGLAAALLLAGLAGIAALVGSPYWSIVYRESPLRRAVTGATDLDERELALRDRAHGLTYFLFVLVNLLLLSGAAAAIRVNGLMINAHLLVAAIVPYSSFAIGLPVILLEWFEPSAETASADDQASEEA